MLVISNRPHASRSSDFEITRAITPWIVLHSVPWLLLIRRANHMGIQLHKVQIGHLCLDTKYDRALITLDILSSGEPITFWTAQARRTTAKMSKLCKGFFEYIFIGFVWYWLLLWYLYKSKLEDKQHKQKTGRKSYKSEIKIPSNAGLV